MYLRSITAPEPSRCANTGAVFCFCEVFGVPEQLLLSFNFHFNARNVSYKRAFNAINSVKRVKAS